MQIFDIVEELEKERKKNKELEEEIKKLKKYEKQYIIEAGTNHILTERIDKAIEYINVINKTTPSSPRKDYAKMILINYEDLLDILKGDNK